MPWQKCDQMDERLKFIARLLDGERMQCGNRFREMPADAR
jgi:hypothetical protein